MKHCHETFESFGICLFVHLSRLLIIEGLKFIRDLLQFKHTAFLFSQRLTLKFVMLDFQWKV